MKLYEIIAKKYQETNSNFFAVTGNINDITIYMDKEEKQRVKQIKEVLISKLQKSNHVLYFSPSIGIKYTQSKHLEEFYEMDENLKEIHQKAFSFDYAHTKYDILSGLHMIKVLLSSYRQMRERYVDKEIKNLVVLIDDSDIVFPNKPIEHMGSQEKLILSLAREIFGNSDFINSNDSIILLSNNFFSIDESVRSIGGLSLINVPLPDEMKRKEFIKYENAIYGKNLKTQKIDKIAQMSAGITLFTLKSILKQDQNYIIQNIKNEVSEDIEKRLGRHVVMLHPSYGFDQVIGYESLKSKAKTLIARMDSKHPWRAIAYIGATGTGKDFQTEAFLYEAALPVIKLQNIKSKWYGETAVILEKIKMVARSFNKIVIYRPEADKLFPDPEAKDAHQTDQEVAGIFLDWMSDSKDRGKIFWVFNTSRPQMFPVDFQRRIEIKLPIFDLQDAQRAPFIEKMFKISGLDLKRFKLKEYDLMKELLKYTQNLSSDNIRMMVQEVVSVLEVSQDDDILEIIKDLNFDIVKTQRDRQAKEAARFSTYKSLVTI